MRSGKGIIVDENSTDNKEDNQETAKEYQGELTVEHDSSEDITSPAQPALKSNPDESSSDGLPSEQTPPNNQDNVQPIDDINTESGFGFTITAPVEQQNTNNTQQYINNELAPQQNAENFDATNYGYQSQAIDEATAAPGLIAPTGLSEQSSATVADFSNGISALSQEEASPVAVKKSNKKKIILAFLAFLITLGLSLGYVFAIYMPNTPDGVWSHGFKRTGIAFSSAIETLIAPGTFSQFSSGSILLEGTATANDVEISLSVDAKGNQKSSDARLSLGADIEGEQTAITALMKSYLPENATIPNMYFNISGLSTGIAANVAGEFAQYDGQWIAVEQDYLRQFEPFVGSNGDSPLLLTAEEYSSIAQDVDALLREFVFTDETSKAIVEQVAFINTEGSEGVWANRYRAKVNIDNFKKLCVASVIRFSENTSAQKIMNYDGSDMAEVVKQYSEECGNIQPLEEDDEFDIWIDKNLKILHKVRFSSDLEARNEELRKELSDCLADPQQSQFGCSHLEDSIINGEQYVEFGQTYTGGDMVNLFTRYTSLTNKESNTLKVDITVNRKTFDYAGITVMGDLTANDEVFRFDMTGKFEPYNGIIESARPENSLNVYEILESLRQTYGSPEYQVQPYILPEANLGELSETL